MGEWGAHPFFALTSSTELKTMAGPYDIDDESFLPLEAFSEDIVSSLAESVSVDAESPNPVNPHTLLRAEVLCQAVRDIGAGSAEDRADALAWVKSNDITDLGFDFCTICISLAIEPSWMRKKILHAYESGKLAHVRITRDV